MHLVRTMKSIQISFILIYMFKNVDSQFVSQKMIADFLTKQKITTCYFFLISSKQDKIHLSSALSKNNIRMAFLDRHCLNEVITDGTTTEKNIFMQLNEDAALMNITIQITKKNKARNTNLFLVINSTSILNMLGSEQVNLGISSKIFFIFKRDDKYEFLNLHANGMVKTFLNVGFWKNEYFHMKNDLFNKQKELSGVHLRAYTRYSSKFLLDTKVTPQELIDKFHFALFLLLHELHNFTYVVKRTRIRNVQDDDLNKTINLLGNQFEIVTTGVLQTPSKIDKIDFLMPFFKFKTCFFFRRPQKSTVSFIQPFSTNTWLATLVVSVILTILLKIAFVASKAEETTWNFAAMTVFSTLCQDGDDPSPDSHDLGCKLIFLSLLIMSLLLFNYYTSSMVSLLLSPVVDTDHTVDELTRSRFEAGVDTSYVKNWLDEVNFTDTAKLYTTKLTRGSNHTMNIYLPEDGIAKVRNEKFAYHTDYDTAYYFIGRIFNQEEMCSLSRVKMIPPSMVGLVIKKNSHLFEIFQTSLLKMNQNGVVNKLSKTWKVSDPECYDNTEVVPWDNDQSLPAIIFLGAGMLASLIILGVEFAWVAFKKKV